MTLIKNIAVDPAYSKLNNGALAAEPRNDMEMRAARALRQMAYRRDYFAPAFLLSFGLRLADPKSCSDCLRYALLCLDPDFAHLFALDGSGEPISEIRLLTILNEPIPAGATTSWSIANGFIGHALRSLKELGCDQLIDCSGLIPTLSAQGIEALFSCGGVRDTLAGIDLTLRVQATDGTWVLPGRAAIDITDAALPVTTEFAVPSIANIKCLSVPAAAPSPVGPGLVQVEAVARASVAVEGGTSGDEVRAGFTDPMAVSGSILIDDAAPIADLVDAFLTSPLAPSRKPHVTPSTIRIVLHALGLTSHDSITELRAALGSPRAARLHADTRARSAAYGVTAQAGSRFNATDASPEFCLRQAKIAKTAKRQAEAGYWQELNKAQKDDRENRWTAFVGYLPQAPLAAGPLPAITW